MLPFDMRYNPDLAIRLDFPMSEKFPSYIGNGTLFVRPNPQNLVNQFWIIDNLCIQFTADAKIHILDMTSDKYTIFDMDSNPLTRDEEMWLMKCTKISQMTMEKITKNPQLLDILQCFIDVIVNNNFSRKTPNETHCKRQIEYTFDVEIKNKRLFHNGNEITWGRVGLQLARSAGVPV